MLAPHKHVRTCTHANTLAHTDLFNLSHVLFFFATGDGKDESLKFTNPEDEVNWEEEQKVCNYKQLTYYVQCMCTSMSSCVQYLSSSCSYYSVVVFYCFICRG